MIGIVIPLKSKQVSRDWNVTIACLNRTLNSLIKQSNKNFYAVIVGHDFDNLNIEDYPKELFGFLTFDQFSSPVRTGIKSEDQSSFEFDRTNKILKGMEYIQNQFDINLWFSLDADDILSIDFVQYSDSLDCTKSYIIQSGYSYYSKEDIFYPEKEFFKYCGSSVLLSNDLIREKINFSPEMKLKIPFCCASHVLIDSYFKENNIEFRLINKPIVCYVRESGDNISDEAYRLYFVDYMKTILKKAISRFISNIDKSKFFE